MSQLGPAIFQPHGNRGADLIETIRLQTLAGNKHVFIRPHPAVDERKRVPIKRTSYAKPWNEPRWNRPQSAAARTSNMRVHSSEQLKDILEDPPPSRSTVAAGPDRSAAGSPLPGSPMPGTSPSQFGSQEIGSDIGRSPTNNPPQAVVKRRPHSALAAPGAAQRAAHVRQQHLESQARVMAKLKQKQQERAAKQERDFKLAWESYQEEQAGHVADMSDYLSLQAREDQRRAHALCKHWNEEVFDKIQDYLETLRKKEAGIFRDIIIEQEYDPFYHAEKSITYKKKGINDPLKAEAAKATREAAILPRSGKPAKKVPLGRYTLPVADWARLDTTPYGHFAKMIDKPPAPPDKKGRMHSQVHFDHYNAPRGRSVMDKEFPKPKRTFHNTVKR